VLVFFLFQAPVLRWLHNSWRRDPVPTAPVGAPAGGRARAALPALAAAH
jgi:hypothetical protein